LPPDHAAFANGVKIVEGQFEIHGQQVEAVQFNSGPGIGDVMNMARKDASLRVKEQQRALRDCRPPNRSAFKFHQSYQ